MTVFLVQFTKLHQWLFISGSESIWWWALSSPWVSASLLHWWWRLKLFELLSKPFVSMYSKIHVQIWLRREDHIRRFKKTMTMGEEALKVYQSSFKSIYLCQVNQMVFLLHGNGRYMVEILLIRHKTLYNQSIIISIAKHSHLIYYFFGIFSVLFSLTPLKVTFPCC